MIRNRPFASPHAHAPAPGVAQRLLQGIFRFLLQRAPGSRLAGVAAALLALAAGQWLLVRAAPRRPRVFEGDFHRVREG